MKTKILFVCSREYLPFPGCRRNHAAHRRERGLGAEIAVDSAGTYAGHTGELPDARMRRAASRRGYDLTHRARQIREEDFGKFDMIVVMDDPELRARAPAGAVACGCRQDLPYAGVFQPPSRAGIMFPIPITKVPRASSWCSTCWKTAAEGILAHLGNTAGMPGGRVQVSVPRKTLPAPRHAMRNTGPEVPGPVFCMLRKSLQKSSPKLMLYVLCSSVSLRAIR